MLPAKCLVRSLWRKNKYWDEPLDEGNQSIWKDWLKDLTRLSELELPRCFCVNTCPEASIQLHVFADASEMGFGAVCYARYLLPDGTIKISFVMARNRVAPLKQLSIPRLELRAAVLAVWLCCVVKQELTVNIKVTIFWSDSKTVLQYIANESRRFHTFVAKRVLEIHDATDPTQWRHVHLAIEALGANKQLPVKSRLSALSPYVDEAECLRVGGRLRKIIDANNFLYTFYGR